MVNYKKVKPAPVPAPVVLRKGDSISLTTLKVTRA